MIPGMLPGSLPGLLPGLMQGIQQAKAEAEQKTAPARKVIDSVMLPQTKASATSKVSGMINSRLPGLLPALNPRPAPATSQLLATPADATENTTDEAAAEESAAPDNQLPVIIPSFRPRR
jgi:hypothetical protein